VRFFEPENEADMARQMAAVASDPALRSEMARRGREYVEHNGWDAHREEYLDIVDRLSGRPAR
jgi:glycosyltransferase involved in cell wall biosynthesis